MNRLISTKILSILTVFFAFLLPPRPISAAATPSDFDGDGKTDISIYRPSNGQWWVQRSSDLSHFVVTFGVSTDRIVPADYTGDGKTDIAVWRPASGEWFVLRSEDFSYYAFPFGLGSDIPVPADYDGDGKADPAVFRPSTGVWYILKSLGGIDVVPFGASGDLPADADYDGDGRADLSVRRGAEWWIRNSADGTVYARPFSSPDPPTELGLPADYTGDGQADLSVYSVFNNSWKYRKSETGSLDVWTGLFGVPVPGDYNGDHLTDRAMFDPSTGVWSIYLSSGAYHVPFGASGDIPTPSAYSR